MPKGFEGDVYFNKNGVLTEHRWIGGNEVVVHYEDIPESDCTTVDGIPCTTALRTMIDSWGTVAEAMAVIILAP